ncbi:SEC-C metal-binding domain-containing protein [Singulisphaera sp. GP187]|uniref:SEC-C metal-binding domain-containing protein n=1 Tax=Singulisphaera sp. GP187 TaxID=1882752 RepID=UPI001C1FDF50
MSHATRYRRCALLSRSCPSGVGGILSETRVKRGSRIVHGNKELQERLGRNDLCPCGSGLLFKKCCRNAGCF